LVIDRGFDQINPPINHQINYEMTRLPNYQIHSVSTDVLVIGSGIIGCAIARELARRGASVAIIDDRPVAMGATQASAGVLAPFIEMRDSTPLLGPAVRSLELYEEFVRSTEADSGLSIRYRRTGTIDLALDDEEHRGLAATASVISRLGVEARLLDAKQARAEEPLASSRVAGGLLVSAHAYVAATELTRALAEAAARHGARMLEPARVRSVAQRGVNAVVTTDKAVLTCGAVVLAAGSWSGQVQLDGVSAGPPVRPVRGQLLSLKWAGDRLHRITWSSGCYLVPWDDGTVLLGATVEEVGFDERATVAGVQGLLEAARRVLPVAESAQFNGARVGLRPATSDGLPIIGRSRVLPSLMYATGHYRNGVLLAPLTASLVADALLDNRIDPMLAPFAPERFGAL
jgi:glycine oxidase